MESSIFFGGSVIAAVMAGTLALFASCCISFMLSAYFASSFQNRLRLVAMTFLFAAGVATIILPIALGASLLLLVGGAMIWVGLTSAAMPTPTGWQAMFFAWLQLSTLIADMKEGLVLVGILSLASTGIGITLMQRASDGQNPLTQATPSF